MGHPFKTVIPTVTEKEALEVARVGFMAACPFFAHYFYSEMEEVFTKDIPTAATDGRRIFLNPEYVAGKKPAERVFIYAHEVDHVINRDPQRGKNYSSDGSIRDKPWDATQANYCMDYRINAGLLEQGIGMMNPSWLYKPDVTGDDLFEDVYEKHYKKPDDGQGGGGGGAGSTYGASGKAPKGAAKDDVADANGGSFDQVLEPQVDPVTGKVDLPDEMEFKEAIARAASAAKAIGNLPGYLQRKIDEILQPQVNWREHIRLLITGKIGRRGEDWSRPNRRRLVLNPLTIMPGKKGNGAGTVGVFVDTSGSITAKELAAYLTEVGGILQDVKPREILVIGCDARVTQVETLRNMDELGELRNKGVKGGGGTRFDPPFEYVAENQIKLDTAIYLTDMYGSFPSEAPSYPVIWAATSDVAAPWGETVKIKV